MAICVLSPVYGSACVADVLRVFFCPKKSGNVLKCHGKSRETRC